MNNYKRALNKIIVTKEMEERIMEGIKVKTNKEVRNNRKRWLIPSGVAASLVVIVCLTLFLPQLKQGNGGEQVQIPNPIVQTDDIKQLKENMPFTIKIPTVMPIGYEVKMTSSIAGTLAQIVYSNGTNDITYRMAEGTDDISGDYTNYDKVKEITVNDLNVTFKGDESGFKIANWNDGTYAYAISFTAGMEEDMMKSIVESIQ